MDGIQQNNIQDKTSQHNNTQHNDIQHDDNQQKTVSISKLSMTTDSLKKRSA